MPANNFINSAYDRDRTPLLEYHIEEKVDWEDEEIDRNGNHLYEEDLRREKLGLGQVPESGVQLYPELISNFTSTLKNFPTKYPKERRKALIAFLMMVFGFTCNSISILLTHQKVPDRTLHPPLPDISLDNLTKRRWLNDLADIFVMVCTLSSVILIVLHRHRWILCRRVFIILSILYCMRSVTMYATVLPLANDHVYCSPKLNFSSTVGQSVITLTEEVLKLMAAGGLSITGKKTLCGDYIFSGHTIIFLMAYLLINEYIPKKFAILHWTSWLTAWTGMICLLVSHGHYTIDVIVAYYATTRLFWIYHLFSNNPELQRKSSTNSLSEVWWFPLFQYFEGNVKGPLPKEYSIPRTKYRTKFTLSGKGFVE